MIKSANDMLEFESLIADAFELLHRAVDMVDPYEDHRKAVQIKKLIESKILCHEPYVHNSWLKKQAKKAAQELDELADMADGISY